MNQANERESNDDLNENRTELLGQLGHMAKAKIGLTVTYC
jgi:hypothetical protein